MPKTRFAFTPTRITQLPAPSKGRATYHDAKTQGLSLRVSVDGRKVFCWWGRFDGKAERITIGPWPAKSLEDARRAALQFANDVANGIDPAAKRQGRRTVPKLGDLFAAWMEHAKGHKKSWREDQRQYDRYLASWAGRRLDSLTRPDVSAWHAKIGKEHGTVQANRALALLSAMFGRSDKLLGFDGKNPCRGVEKFPERPRERYLSADEMRPFFAALLKQEPHWRDYFLLAILTAARRINLAAMRWSQLDLANGVWHISAEEMKNGKAMAVALSPPAVAILQGRLAQAGESDHVFPSRGKKGHLTYPYIVWKKLTKDAGIADIRPHDLRRTLGSWLAGAGVPLQAIAQALGHAETSTTEKVYAHLELHPVRTAVTAAGNAMLDAAGPAARLLLGNGSGEKE